MIEIDGSTKEGGGQILRTAASLSVITKKPCHIFNIRQNRPQPGLMAQHLAGIRALRELCDGKLEGDETGSEKIWFSPGEIQPKDLRIEIKTAGSITLALQSLILPCLFAPGPVKITFKGGATDTFFSPSFDYFYYVFLGVLKKITGKKVADIKIKKRGFYPEGGAEVKAEIFPTALKPFNLTKKGSLERVLVISGASESLKLKRAAERQAASIREILGKLKLPLEEKIEYYRSQSPGSAVNIIAEFENTVIGVDNLGKLGKSAEQTGKEAALDFLREAKSQAGLDKHLADQILPFMAFSPSPSKAKASELTKHAETNIWAIEKFLGGSFEIKDNFISFRKGRPA